MVHIWDNKTKIQNLKKELEHKPDVQPIPINQVGGSCKGNKGNINMHVECNLIQILAILDIRAHVSIATKQIWET